MWHENDWPVDSCPAFYNLQFPDIHTWHPQLGKYTDPEIRLRMIDQGKFGSPYKRDP